MAGVIPVDGLVDDLALADPVERHRGLMAMLRDGFEDFARDLAREQPPHQRLAVPLLDDGAVAQDERQRRRELLEDRPGKVVAAAGRQRDLDTLVDHARDRVDVLGWEVSVTVEQGSVDIEGEQADHSITKQRRAINKQRARGDCTASGPTPRKAGRFSARSSRAARP